VEFTLDAVQLQGASGLLDGRPGVTANGPGAETSASPLFSICMPACNAERTVSEAIQSVLAQSCKDWELVIVDDGSTDGTAELARAFAERDPRVHVISQENMGCGPARGVAVTHARAPLLCRLDADDLYLPAYLDTMRRFIDAHPGFDIYACNGWRLYADGSRRIYHDGPGFRRVVSLTTEDLLRESLIFTTAVFSRRAYQLAGGMRPGVYCEDYDFWLRAMSAGARHIYCPAPLALYRDSGAQMTADVIRLYESQMRVLRDVVATGRLTQLQVEIARHSIRLLAANVRFRRCALRTLGPRRADTVFRLAHSLAWVIRPYRLRRR
jgi:GT2 family glycosyltransferase